MQGGRGVKIVIFMALRCKVMENTRKTAGAWGKSFSGPPRGPEEQRTYEQRTRLHGLWPWLIILRNRCSLTRLSLSVASPKP